MPFGRRVRRRRLWPGLLAGASAAAAWTALPLPAGLLAPPAATGFALLDRSGLTLRTTRSVDGARQRWLPLESIDPDLMTAFVAAEDRRFYAHRGVDGIALGRALLGNLRGGRVTSGASTITMQLARMVHPSAHTILGKVVQAAWALRIDAHLPKQVILEQYLNRVPLGQGVEGVDAAARLYFGVSAEHLGLGQAALLGGLARAPSRDNPLTSRRRALDRRDLVLDRMARLGLASEPALGRAREEPVLAPPAADRFVAPHFTTWLLSRRLGDSVPAGGAVRTSLDGGLQAAIEAEVAHTVAEMRRAGARQAAAVVLANRTGEILAWVGSPDFFDPTAGQVDMVVSPRQPGSTLKPFLYGLAFDRGYTPGSVLPDVATVYRTATGPYAPRNYDRRFHGPVRIREALGSSFNVPAVELTSRVGVPSLLDVLHRAGFASLRRRADYYGLGLALGNGEVTLLELANAYRSLANGGVWHPVHWTPAPAAWRPGERRTVMTARSAAQVLDVLADPIARMPGFGPSTPLELPFRAAAKTGTSRHFTDNWAVAVTGRFTVAVWVGNFNGRPMDGVSGVSGAGPLLQRVVLATADRYDPGSLPTPGDAGLEAATICAVSGLAAGPSCPTTTEWYRPGTVPNRTCDWHGADGVHLPPAYAEWVARSGAGNAIASAGIMRVATDSGRIGFRITSPRDGDRYRFVPDVDPAYATIGLRAAGAPGRVRWFVDGRSFRGARWPLEAGTHTIRATTGALADEVTIEVLR